MPCPRAPAVPTGQEPPGPWACRGGRSPQACLKAHTVMAARPGAQPLFAWPPGLQANALSSLPHPSGRRQRHPKPTAPPRGFCVLLMAGTGPSADPCMFAGGLPCPALGPALAIPSSAGPEPEPSDLRCQRPSFLPQDPSLDSWQVRSWNPRPLLPTGHAPHPMAPVSLRSGCGIQDTLHGIMPPRGTQD